RSAHRPRGNSAPASFRYRSAGSGPSNPRHGCRSRALDPSPRRHRKFCNRGAPRYALPRVEGHQNRRYSEIPGARPHLRVPGEFDPDCEALGRERASSTWQPAAADHDYLLSLLLRRLRAEEVYRDGKVGRCCRKAVNGPTSPNLSCYVPEFIFRYTPSTTRSHRDK